MLLILLERKWNFVRKIAFTNLRKFWNSFWSAFQTNCTGFDIWNVFVPKTMEKWVNFVHMLNKHFYFTKIHECIFKFLMYLWIKMYILYFRKILWCVIENFRWENIFQYNKIMKRLLMKKLRFTIVYFLEVYKTVISQFLWDRLSENVILIKTNHTYMFIFVLFSLYRT